MATTTANRVLASGKRRRFDPEDYADEWRYLTRVGTPASQIIARSRPSRDWFFVNIRMRVTDAICSECGTHFNPSQTRTLTKCNKSCGAARQHGQAIRRAALWQTR